MTLNNKHKSVETRIDNRRAESELDSEEDMEEPVSDVKKMAEKILEYRSTIPDQLHTTLASVLSSQRTNFSDVGSEPGSSGELNPDSEETELEQRREKTRVLKEKISSNISAMPVIVNRMKECISRMEKLNSGNVVIHPAFKKRKVVHQ